MANNDNSSGTETAFDRLLKYDPSLVVKFEAAKRRIRQEYGFPEPNKHTVPIGSRESDVMACATANVVKICAKMSTDIKQMIRVDPDDDNCSGCKS